MMTSFRLVAAIWVICSIPLSVFAEAPVIDGNENSALIDEPQAAFGQPVDRDDERALAHDNVGSGNNAPANNGLLLDKIQGLQQDIQELRGQIEVQAHDLKLLQEQQLSFYKDLDARIRNEPTPKASVPIKNNLNTAHKSPVNTVLSPPVTSQSQTNPADEQISYLAAYELIKNKKFDQALDAMQNFVNQHPQSGYAANAQYWLGELYMLKKDYANAISHFDIVVQQYPSSNKIAACLLKSGYALAASGQKQEAIERLQQVVKNYPGTNTAQLAKVKLDSLSH
jgi:tol-pal system protein YbgF